MFFLKWLLFSMNKSTFCVLPFIHLEARADGFVAPCCMSQTFYKGKDGKPFHLSKNTLSEIWNSDSINALRENLNNGVKDKACEACWTEESVGRISRRLRENKRWQLQIDDLEASHFQNKSPIFLDLKLGNTCNLKCRICGPGSSSSWVKEWKDVTGSDLLERLSNDVANNANKRIISSWPDTNPKFWEDFSTMLPTIKSFEIFGGEPFLIKQHFDLLKKSVNLGYSKGQRIHYNSNGTIFPEQAIAEIWPHFENVHLMLSIDGIGPQFEYQRHPARWAPTEENILKFKSFMSNRDLHICMTVSSINAYYLPDYLKYFHKIEIPVWLNILYEQKVFSIKNLPMVAKNAILEKWTSMGEEKSILTDPIDPLINYLMNESDIEEENKLIEFLKQHDLYRNEKYSDFFPEFANIIGY